IIMLQTYSSLYSQTSGGGYAGSYLYKETGARQIALAGAFTAVSNDPMTIFYNPAGFASCAPVPMIILSLSQLEHGRNYANLSYGQSFEEFGIGISLTSFKSGTFTAINSSGIVLGNFTDYFTTIAVGTSYSTGAASFGATAKYLNNSLAGSGISGYGFAFDFGSKFDVFNLFNFGLSIQNIGGFLKFNTREEKSTIPFRLRAGIATEIPLSEPKTIIFRNEIGLIDSLVQPPPEFILISLDAQFIQYQKYPSFVLALELTPIDILTIRGGITIAGETEGLFKLFPMTVWGMGLSIKPTFLDFYNLFSIDFSLATDYISVNKIFYTLGLSLQF
ncbi:MAG: PorV/PorQ family protein, partial [Candidatus Kapaibacteriota bacterium]